MNSSLRFFSKATAFFTLAVLSLILLHRPQVWAKEDAEPQPLEFQVQFTEDNPHEIVLTAERYRREFMNEDIEEKDWQNVYFNRAKRLYEKAFLIDPYFTYGYLSYAYTHLLAGETMGDKTYHRQQANQLLPHMDEENPWVSLLQGQLYCWQDNWEQAKTSIEKAQQLGASNSSFYSWLGYTLAATKNDNGAQEAYQKAISANTDPASVKWAENQLGKTGKPWQQPPITAALAPRQVIHPAATKTRLRVADFEDATGIMGKPATIFSRLLATTLFQGRRFQMVDEAKDVPQAETWPLEAVVSGTIVHLDTQTSQFTLDIKATHASSGNLLLAETVPILYTYIKEGNTFHIADKEVRKIADMIERKLVRGEGRIVHIEGRHLLVNLGSENGVQSGFGALVIGKGEKIVKDPQSGDILSRDIYLGEIVFERVEEKFSEARLLTPGRIFVRVGDIVRLK